MTQQGPYRVVPVEEDCWAMEGPTPLPDVAYPKMMVQEQVDLLNAAFLAGQQDERHLADELAEALLGLANSSSASWSDACNRSSVALAHHTAARKEGKDALADPKT